MNRNYVFRPLFDGFRGQSNPVIPGWDNAWSPAVDIKEEDNHFLIIADVPGVNPEDIEITAERGVVTIKGQRHADSSRSADRYHHVERTSGRFERRFALPETADADNIQAKSQNGVLAVVIGKKEAARPRRIEVATH